MTTYKLPSNVRLLALSLGLALLLVFGYMVWFENNRPIELGGDNILIHPKTTVANTQTQTSVNNDLVYSNNTYGFSLTFNNKWKGYKIKTVQPTDGSAIAYLYVNMPTESTDEVWASDGPTNLAGYASVFAIGVYTQAQWDALTDTPGQGTKIGQSLSYVFGYNSAQDYPADISDQGLPGDVGNVVSTFKANY